MPSVLDQPTDQPARWKQKPSIREVVVLPFVPVTATTGIGGPEQLRAPSPGRRRGQPRRRGSSVPAEAVPCRDRVQRPAPRPSAEHLRPAGVAPRVGDDQLVDLDAGPGPDGEALDASRPAPAGGPAG